MSTTKILTGLAAVVAAAGLIGTGAALSNAASPSPTPTASGTTSQGGAPGGDGEHGPGAGQDTPVTGTRLAEVTRAVKAKDSTVTVTAVRMDPDGSYDVLGTKAGAKVMLEVSKDLRTITTHAGGPRG